MKSKLLIILLSVGVYFSGNTQNIPAGFPVLESFERISQLDSDSYNNSFLVRPVNAGIFDVGSKSEDLEIYITPLLNSFRYTSKRPYGWSDYGMISTPGFQWYVTGGAHVKWKRFSLSFIPDFTFAQNSKFEGYSGFKNSSIEWSRFVYWNIGDSPERYGKGNYFRVGLGQSNLSYGFGSFELSASNENIWWGPGQFNSLTFSNNAPGFLHFSLNTRQPAKTFLGNFEMQLISGWLKSNRYPATQSDSLNNLYFLPKRDKNRYLNALTVSYNPKWVDGLYVGATRTVQTFVDSVGANFIDVFPVFWGITKESVGSDLIGASDKGKSQQITIFGRYKFKKAKAEVYFEFGRRDHALNWREFILNPEHARAFMLGFNKIFRVEESNFLIKGEITHQQEAVNRYIRYLGLNGGATWHTNGSIGGFTNYDQPLGVGIGTGSNVQTIEVSKIMGMDKIGIQFERLANNQDFYYKAQLQDTERKPWVDLSIGFLFDKKWDNLLLSSKLQFIHANNYQWQLSPESTPDFPVGENMTSILAQTSLVYFWNK